MYACIPQNTGGFFEVACTPSNATANIRDPSPKPFANWPLRVPARVNEAAGTSPPRPLDQVDEVLRHKLVDLVVEAVVSMLWMSPSLSFLRAHSR